LGWDLGWGQVPDRSRTFRLLGSDLGQVPDLLGSGWGQVPDRSRTFWGLESEVWPKVARNRISEVRLRSSLWILGSLGVWVVWVSG